MSQPKTKLQLLREAIQFFIIQKKAALRLWVKDQPRWRLWGLGLGIPVVLGITTVGLLTISVYLGIFGPLPTYGELSNIKNSQASVVYAEDGAVLGKYFIENRTDVELEDISPFVVDALIATEDARFFEHSGIDVRALARVMVKSLLLQDDAAGGGSTLSQQLAKNLFPRQQHAFLSMPINKLKEMFTARRLENTYSKEDLLMLYLNTVPFGENAFGLQVAAFRYFGKTPAELNVEEAATLVGMLKATSYYNPRKHPEAATERRNTVLVQMSRFGKLDTALVDSLHKLPLELDFRTEGHNEGLATYFREYLRQEVLAVLDRHKKPDGGTYNLYRDGLKIYTTIDSRLQAYAESAVAKRMPEVQARFAADWRNRKPWTNRILEKATASSKRYRTAKQQGLDQASLEQLFATPVSMTVFDWRGGAVDTLLSPLDSIKHYLTLLNTGVLAVEPASGQIRVWVGGIDHRFIQFDHIKARRPVGSTFKPIVYTAALQNGMMPCEYTEDTLKVYEEYENWTPQNSDGKYGGAYSLAGALSKSINTIAVTLAQKAGIPNVRKLATDMGIDSDIPKGPAIALGAVDASLIDMVTVYSTFANRGNRPTKLHYLNRIETADGQVVAAFDPPTRSQFAKVLEPGHADMILNIMQSVVDSGTARRLRTHYGIRSAIAGKTGTTQDQADGWFIGFNDKLVAGVWVGAEQGGIHFRTLSRGQASRTALPIFGDFWRRIERDRRFRHIRNASYPAPPDMVLALLDCPPYLPELPIFMDEGQSASEINEWSQTVDAIDPVILEKLLRENPRRNHERLSNYARRIRRKYEREYEPEARDERRREFWEKLLFRRDDDG